MSQKDISLITGDMTMIC